uniref:SAFB-like transcription modulator-like isoform X2 n=1 Tax=Saccoglossus kowalevskii TaxID=10224 RepID=A0ABM0M7H5_SACKO|nr:PREDICTED: SAFB-like transcription modulator-like isoform X2 [Saccoglossus kowalevskii]
MAETIKKKVTELRVIDLRAELEKRGQEKAGIKAVLIERLQKAIEGEGGDPEYISLEKQTTPGKGRGKSLEKDGDEVLDDSQTEEDAEEPMEVEESETANAKDEKNGDEKEEKDEKVTKEDDKEDNKTEDAVEMETESKTEKEKEVNGEDKDVAEDEEDLNDVININVDEDQLLLIEDEVEGSSDEKVSSSQDTPTKDDGDAAATVPEPPTPGSAPVIAPLTKEDTIKMDTSAIAKSDDNVSLVVHADDQSIMELDSDLQENQKKPAEKLEAEKSPKKEDTETKTELAEDEKKPDDVEQTAESTEDKKDETKKEDMVDKNADDAAESTKDSSTPTKKSPSSTSSSARTKSTSTSKDTGKSTAKDEKDRRGSSSRSASASSGKNLWVSNLSSTTKATDLKSAFSKYGKVIGAKIVTNAHSPGARCYGFVTMSSHAEANKAFHHLHRTELHGRIIYVEWAKTDPAASSRKPTDKKDTPSKTSDAKKPETAKTTTAAKTSPKKDVASDGSTATKKEGDKSSTTTAKKDDKTEKKVDEKKGSSKPNEKDASGASGKGRTVVMDKSKGEPVVSLKPKKDGKPSTHSEHEKRKSSTPSQKSEKEILSFHQIKEMREKERKRQMEREMREIERRREKQRQEQVRIDRDILRRKQREEADKIRREREMLARERDRLEKERAERERLEQERMRLQRERIREQERLEREREEQRRLEAQIRLDQERRAGLKRSFENRNLPTRDNDPYFTDAKRVSLGYESTDVSRPDQNRYSDFDFRDRGTQLADNDRGTDSFERRVERYDRRDGRSLDTSDTGNRFSYTDTSTNVRRQDSGSFRTDNTRRDDVVRRDEPGRRDSAGTRREAPVRRDPYRKSDPVQRSVPVKRVDQRRDYGMRKPEPVSQRRDSLKSSRETGDRRIVTSKSDIGSRGRQSTGMRDDRAVVRHPTDRDRGRVDTLPDRSRDRGHQTLRDSRQTTQSSGMVRRMDSSSRGVVSGSRGSPDWKTDRGAVSGGRSEWKPDRGISSQDRRSDVRSTDRRDRPSDSGRRGGDSSYESRQQQTGHFSDVRRDHISDSWQSRGGIQDDRSLGRSETRGHGNQNFGPGLLGAPPPVGEEPQQWPQGGLENPTVNRHGERWPGSSSAELLLLTKSSNWTPETDRKYQPNQDGALSYDVRKNGFEYPKDRHQLQTTSAPVMRGSLRIARGRGLTKPPRGPYGRGNLGRGRVVSSRGRKLGR